MARRLSHESSLVIVGRSKIHGRGVFARCRIPCGAYILEYTGEKMTRREGQRRHTLQERKGAFYVFELNKRWHIDGAKGGDARLINHGCDPNCTYQIQDGRIWIRALRNIRKGEELTYNYDVTEQGKYACKCGAKTCKGVM